MSRNIVEVLVPSQASTMVYALPCKALLLSKMYSIAFRLLDNTETMERSTRKLDQGQEMLEESQNVGVNILNDLALQRETLTRARNRVSEIWQQINKGRMLFIYEGYYQ